MKVISIVVLTSLAVASCAATAGKIINGNSSSVTIQHDGSYSQSTELAVQHCAEFGKDARLIHTEGWIMSFDCTPRP